jgi:hypothetical protein
MLMNNDIQKIICSNDFTFSKEINIIMYIIEKTFKLNFNHFIWTKFQ